jgi:hypothetical protein
MNKQEIQNEIKETRQKLEQLEQRLNEPEKFKFQGGDYRFTAACDFSVIFDQDIDNPELPARTQTREDGERLAKYLKNQAIIWQVAEHVNGGWVRSNFFNDEAYEVFYNEILQEFCKCGAERSQLGIFKNRAAALKACDILNSQDTGYEI